MSVSGILSSSITSAYTPPPPVQQQAKATQQSAPKTDTVSLSSQALQLASDGDPAALEAQESSSEKSSETAKGKA
jgi:hypothetical protein